LAAWVGLGLTGKLLVVPSNLEGGLVKGVMVGQRGTGGGGAYWGLVGAGGHMGKGMVQKLRAWGAYGALSTSGAS